MVLLRMRPREELVERAVGEILLSPVGLARRTLFRGFRNGRRHFGWVHDEMGAHYARAGGSNGWSAVAIPRDHAKSTLGACTLVWRKIWDSDHRLFLAAADLGLASGLLGVAMSVCGSKVYLDDGTTLWLSDLFEWIRPVSSVRKKSAAVEEFYCVGRTGPGAEPCFFAESPQTGMAGKHPTGGHVDDLCTEKGARSPTIRLQSIDFLMRLPPVLLKSYRSPVTAAGTPWHFHDPVAYYRSAPEWRCLKYGILDGRNGDKTLCPSFKNWDEWVAIRDNPKYSPDWISAQYHCEPHAVANAVFNEPLVASVTRKDWPLERVQDEPYASFILWDPTKRIDAKNLTGDANGIVAVKPIPNHVVGVPGIDKDRNVWFVMLAHQELGGTDAMLQWIVREGAPQLPDLEAVYGEEIFLTSNIRPWAQQTAPNIVFRPAPIESTKKEYRLMALASAFRSGMICFPPQFPGKDLLVRQLIEFPKSDHDDVPDALSLLSSMLYRRGPMPAKKREVLDSVLHTAPRRRHNAGNAWSR